MTGTEGCDAIRIDKWLWHARFFKSRNIAAARCRGGGVRVNATHVKKPSQMVRPGDVLTFTQAREIRVIEIVECGTRRGPATEAQMLYRDLSPPAVQDETSQSDIVQPAQGRRARGSGRPTKAERRATDKLKGFPGED